MENIPMIVWIVLGMILVSVGVTLGIRIWARYVPGATKLRIRLSGCHVILSGQGWLIIDGKDCPVSNEPGSIFHTMDEAEAELWHMHEVKK